MCVFTSEAVCKTCTLTSGLYALCPLCDQGYQKSALFRCCDAPQKIKKERKGEERRERKRRKEGKEERKRRKGKEGKEERKGRKGKGKKGERKRRGKEGEEVVTKVSRVDMGRA